MKNSVTCYSVCSKKNLLKLITDLLYVLVSLKRTEQQSFNTVETHNLIKIIKSLNNVNNRSQNLALKRAKEEPKFKLSLSSKSPKKRKYSEKLNFPCCGSSMVAKYDSVPCENFIPNGEHNLKHIQCSKSSKCGKSTLNADTDID